MQPILDSKTSEYKTIILEREISSQGLLDWAFENWFEVILMSVKIYVQLSNPITS